MPISSRENRSDASEDVEQEEDRKQEIIKPQRRKKDIEQSLDTAQQLAEEIIGKEIISEEDLSKKVQLGSTEKTQLTKLFFGARIKFQKPDVGVLTIRQETQRFKFARATIWSQSAAGGRDGDASP